MHGDKIGKDFRAHLWSRSRFRTNFADVPENGQSFSGWMNDNPKSIPNLHGPSPSITLPARSLLELPWHASRPPFARQTVFQLIVSAWREPNRTDFGRWIRRYEPVDPRSASVGSPIWSSRMAEACDRPHVMRFYFCADPNSVSSAERPDYATGLEMRSSSYV